MTEPKPPPDRDDSSASGWTKLAVLLGVLSLAGVGYFSFREQLSLDYLAAQESRLRTLQDQYPLAVYGGAFAVYVLVTGLSLPGATGMTLVLGWYLGFWRALLLVSFASTAGATVAFLLSRYLFRDVFRARFGDRLQTFQEALDREGAFYLFTLRLIPAVPFFVINVVMGLTELRARTFWWVSQLGMLPGTCVYVYAGSAVPNLSVLAKEGVLAAITPTRLTQLLIAFALLGCFPLVVRWLLRWAGGRAPDAEKQAESDK